ncbi:methylenetetrahydrofolate reductase [Helicobacter trogontum]|uniref:Methylenetetrahydrofolate reductase (NAD(P)H) n=1 Tax=Helicobacter trogontum TaxID=50960 RepID=A0A4U8TDD2_9HELI|nr:hypothetical protein [Helicobacter trogontum]TLD98010.1 hypothetical protein LS80_006425 [Helicobacter trogontum]
MIFEYLPTNITQDVERLHLVCSTLPITKVLIPSNPVSKPYPDPLNIVATLRDLTWQSKHLRHIHFIPTIKTSIYTQEALQSIFLSLEYLNISHVAIISGDTTQSKSLTTYNALEILKHMQKKSTFLSNLQLYCALESDISLRNNYGLCKKIYYGVQNFITQPFYQVSKKQNMPQIPHNTLNFLPQVTTDFETFLSFYKNLIHIYTNNKPSLTSLYNKIQIYCGFLPLSHTKQAHAIHAKKLGISVPNSYINAIEKNAKEANSKLFKAMQQYDVSLSCLCFSDIEALLTCDSKIN